MKTNETSIINMDQAQFQQAMAGDKPVLVDFWAPWCVYCRRIAPVMEKVAQQYADTLVVAQVNVDDAPQLAAADRIEVIPTLILYRNGQALGSIVAPESKAKIDQFIQETLNR